MLCMARICSLTYFWIVSYTRWAILNTGIPLRWVRTLDLNFEASLTKEVGYFFPVFFQWWLLIILPWTIAELFPGIAVYKLLALWLSARMCWQWAGPKLHSLLSAHRLIGAYYFLTTERDECMRLLIRHYGIYNIILNKKNHSTFTPPHLLILIQKLYTSIYTQVFLFCWCHPLMELASSLCCVNINSPSVSYLVSLM